jgi:hypothetical protein
LASNHKISNAARSAACDAIVDLIDGGAAAGSCVIRTGAPPANVADADTGNLLATCPFGDPAFGAASNGVASANSITSDTTADTSGAAGHYRYKDSNGNTITQGTCGEAADAPVDMLFDDKDIVAGGTVAVSSATITVPTQ